MIKRKKRLSTSDSGFQCGVSYWVCIGDLILKVKKIMHCGLDVTNDQRGCDGPVILLAVSFEIAGVSLSAIFAALLEAHKPTV